MRFMESMAGRQRSLRAYTALQKEIPPRKVKCPPSRNEFPDARDYVCLRVKIASAFPRGWSGCSILASKTFLATRHGIPSRRGGISRKRHKRNLPACAFPASENLSDRPSRGGRAGRAAEPGAGAERLEMKI